MMMAASAMAQHEIGVIAGGLNGLSYKYWFTDAVALQTDLAVGLTLAPGATYLSGTKVVDFTNSQYDFTLNPNIAYHIDAANMLKFYVGAGLNIGLLSDLTNTNPDYIIGKFGANGLLGFALDLSPFVVALDFRPGYGLGFRDSNTAHLSFFDWKLGLAVRYQF